MHGAPTPWMFRFIHRLGWNIQAPRPARGVQEGRFDGLRSNQYEDEQREKNPGRHPNGVVAEAYHLGRRVSIEEVTVIAARWFRVEGDQPPSRLLGGMRCSRK